MKKDQMVVRKRMEEQKQEELAYCQYTYQKNSLVLWKVNPPLHFC